MKKKKMTKHHMIIFPQAVAWAKAKPTSMAQALVLEGWNCQKPSWHITSNSLLYLTMPADTHNQHCHISSSQIIIDIYYWDTWFALSIGMSSFVINGFFHSSSLSIP